MSLNGNVAWGEVVGIIGKAAAERLSAGRGGRSVYVPEKTPGAASPLVALVGSAAASAMVSAFGGARIEVPLAGSKRAEIRRLRASGLTISEIAAEMRCSRRHVFAVLAEPPPDPPEPPPLLARMGVG